MAHPARVTGSSPTIRSPPESSSHTRRSATRWWPTSGSSETIFAALAAVGGLFLVTVLMGLVAWSAMVATLLRGRLRGAGPCRARHRACARSSRGGAGARHAARRSSRSRSSAGRSGSPSRICAPAAGGCGCSHRCSCSGRTCMRASSRGSDFSRRGGRRDDQAALVASAPLRPGSASSRLPSRSAPRRSPPA